MQNTRQQQLVKQLQDAAKKMSQAESADDQTRWARQVQLYADELHNTSSSRPQRTIFTVEASIPNPEAFQHIVQELQEMTPGIKEVSYRTEGRTPRVRIQATRDVLPNIDQVLQEVGRGVKESYGSE